ncbi:ABC transporter substrate-binding protein [Chitiniphilus shinanonensis]|uniref:ABC transporter substrate-binding protein n=1 Tax=Chitiniphilus shinanonensis TaxID=553088 RepID=A0ABQ6BT26_9NEIS|nr:ABC transporter substrate-binding protein [Chitiniphilus shinanonensis]GLS03048.1 ABC transporter substrate-binding protein [Chitiniphilus shinanonensis]
MKIAQYLAALATLTAALSPLAAANQPDYYPASYASLVTAARKEGKVIVYAATDTAAARPLVKDFEALYPGIKVEYHDMSTTELYNRFISESAAGSLSADVLWSSAMDLQIKLVNDGYTAAYASPELPRLPAWSYYQNQAYGTTYEPVVFVYNKRLLSPKEVPQTHADLARLIKADPARFKGRITTYDIEKSGVGFTYLTQDVRVGGAATWDIVRTMGASGLRLQSSTGTMLERISSGENLIGYNMIGSYAYAKARKDPAIGYVYPKDYTLVMSRLQAIAKTASHPNAARLWVDYLLSRRGQSLLAQRSDIYSLRSDVTGELTIAELTRQLGNSLKPIQVGPGLLVYLDQAKRLQFLKQWRQAIGR